MTNMPENNRLDRVEASLEQLTNTVNSLAQVAQVHQRDIQANSSEVAQLLTTVTALVQIVELHQANHEASQRNFDAIIGRLEVIEAEIKGLRTESLRILEHLFGEQPEQ